MQALVCMCHRTPRNAGVVLQRSKIILRTSVRLLILPCDTAVPRVTGPVTGPGAAPVVTPRSSDGASALLGAVSTQQHCQVPRTHRSSSLNFVTILAQSALAPMFSRPSRGGRGYPTWFRVQALADS